jgi:hypothetical protein
LDSSSRPNHIAPRWPGASATDTSRELMPDGVRFLEEGPAAFRILGIEVTGVFDAKWDISQRFRQLLEVMDRDAIHFAWAQAKTDEEYEYENLQAIYTAYMGYPSPLGRGARKLVSAVLGDRLDSSNVRSHIHDCLRDFRPWSYGMEVFSLLQYGLGPGEDAGEYLELERRVLELQTEQLKVAILGMAQDLLHLDPGLRDKGFHLFRKFLQRHCSNFNWRVNAIVRRKWEKRRSRLGSIARSVKKAWAKALKKLCSRRPQLIVWSLSRTSTKLTHQAFYKISPHRSLYISEAN